MLLVIPTQPLRPRLCCPAHAAHRSRELLQHLSGIRQELGRTGAWSSPLLPPSSFSGLSLLLHGSIFFSQTLQAASAQQGFLDCLQHVSLPSFPV